MSYDHNHIFKTTVIIHVETYINVGKPDTQYETENREDAWTE